MLTKKTAAILTLAACVMAVLPIQACNDTGTVTANNVLVVAASIAPLADFVENVGGDKVEVTVMEPSSYDPHTYEPTPSQMVKISEADIYVKVGSGVEFELAWMDDITAQNADMYVIDCSTGISLIAGGHEHEEDGEEEEHEHSSLDPHIWNSPVKAQQMVENICQGLIAVDPDNEDYYLANKDSYIDALEELDTYARETLNGFSNRYFLIYHPAFGYFAAEYDLTQISVEHEGKEPTPQVIQDCIDKSEAYDLNYDFVAPQLATSYAATIAQEIGGQVLYLDPLPSSYISNMRSVIASIALELE